MELEEFIQLLSSFIFLSLVLEAAFSFLFNWGGYKKVKEKLNIEGLKSIVIFFVVLIVVLSFDISLVDKVVDLSGIGDSNQSGDSRYTSMVDILITTAVLGGGSSGIFEVLKKASVRPPSQTT